LVAVERAATVPVDISAAAVVQAAFMKRLESQSQEP
jgi:hypothetical protein